MTLHRHGLCYKQMPSLSAINYFFVKTVDDTGASVDAKARYWWKIMIFVPFRGAHQNIATVGVE